MSTLLGVTITEVLSDTMEDLLTYQEELLQNLQKAEKNYKKTPKERIKRSYLETRIEILEQLWKDFKDGHKNIILRISKEEQKEDSYFVDNTYEAFEELYVQYKTSLKEALQPFLDSLNCQPLQSSAPLMDVKPVTSEFKLPTIQIPTFSGKYEEWQTFFDLFCSLIHNNKYLSPVQKLHYLKGNLSGEPEILIRNYSTTDANYEEAWNQLTERYNNKRFNCNAILRILFAQKPIYTESATLLKQLVDTTSTCLKSLNNMGVPTDTWDMIINYLVVSKLDSESMKHWEQNLSISNCDLPTWSELKNFLEARFRSLEMIESNKMRTVQPKSLVKPKAFHSNINKNNKVSEIKCAMCSGDHYVYHCKKFGEITSKQRQDFVQANKLCFNCLAPTHSVVKCRQSACCRRCGRRHHTLLHFEKEQNMEKMNEGVSAATGVGSSLGKDNESCKGKSRPVLNETHVVTNFSSEYIHTNNVLLATATILMSSKNGQKHIFRALLDQGSQASFVTEATVQFLNLTRKSVSGWVSGLGEGQTRIKHMVSLYVESSHNPEVSVRVNAYVLRSLTTLLPTANLSSPDWPDIKHLKLADSKYTTPGRVDVLLGAEVYSEILLDGMIKHPKINLVAQNTIFGWVLSGRISQDSLPAKNRVTSLHVGVKEDELLKQFWEMENEPNSIQKRLSKLEERCEEFYDKTTERDEEGRFVVRLPFTNEDPECQYGGSREIAVKRFELLENKLIKIKSYVKNIIRL